MKQNSRLALALHTLSHMANDQMQKQTSADIAAHASTNPVVVRRVLGRLRDAGLLTSEKGHSGGWQLARPAAEITIADVYLALDESMISQKSDEITTTCNVEGAMFRHVSNILDQAEQNLIQRLKETTIAQLHDD